MACRPERAEQLYKKYKALEQEAKNELEFGRAESWELAAQLLLETFPVWLAKYAK